MAEPIYLVQGDNSAQIKATLTREYDGSAVDISSGVVRMRVRDRYGLENLFTLTATIDDAPNGVCIFSFASGELDDLPAGVYVGEIEHQTAQGRKESVYELLEFIVREDFG